MEYLDVVNENNELIGEIEERDIIHEKGIWHREVAVWIMNEKGEVLLQKRAATKKQNPNKWAICAGHIDAGETVECSVLRELEEELGIKATIDELEFINTYKKETQLINSKNYNFQYTYFLKTNAKIEDFTIQLEELSEIKYITLEELENIVKNKDEDFTFSRLEYMPELIEIFRKNIG